MTKRVCETDAEYAARNADYAKKHKRRIAERKKTWRKKNKREIAAWMAAYRRKNRRKLAARSAAYRKKNKRKIAERRVVYGAKFRAKPKNRTRAKVYKAAWYERNKVRLKVEAADPVVKQQKKARMAKWRAENKEWQGTYNAKWKEENAEHVRGYVRARYSNNPQFYLACLLRGRLRMALIGKAKRGSAVRDLGCSLPEFKVHIEKQFWPGMTWDNRGQKGWHLDHKIPLSSFDLTDRKQFLKACHYTNYQPLWGAHNLEKHDRLDWRPPADRSPPWMKAA